MSPQPRSPVKFRAPALAAVRHGLFYALIYLGTGVSMPYLPVWFRSVGLGAPQIGVILAAPMVGRVLAGPLTAVWADGFRLRRTALAGIAAITSAAYALLLVVHGFWPWALCWFVAATGIAALSPLADVLTLIESRRLGFQYTLSRGIGSAAYVLANVVGGIVLAGAAPVVAVVWAAIAAGGCAIGGILLLPPTPVIAAGHASAMTGTAGAAAGRWQGTLALLRVRPLMICLAALSLIQGSHAFYYGFSALSWTSHGVPTRMIGLLWGCAVVAELVFFWWGEGVRSRLGPSRLVLLGAVGAVVRWTALALSPPEWLLPPLQLLHALTFSCTYLGGLVLVERLSPARHASAAQTLSASLSYGLATGLATIASGWLYAHFQGLGYLAMALMAAGGAVLALMLPSAHRRHGS
jgi:MFS transporter, PPP family, 3-phenylpropionic acid transporter